MAREQRKKFKFRETSEKTVKERSTNTGNFDRWIKPKYPTFKVRDGENTGRILPRTWDDTDTWGDNWGIPVKLHYSIGPDKGTYLCNKIRGKTCYLCEERAQLARDGDEGKEASDALRPSDRVIVWWVDRDAEKEGPQVYGMPATKVEVEIQLLSKDDDGSVLQITDPDEGYDVIFTKTGSNLKTDYKGVRLARKPSPIHDKESKQDEWLDFIEANPLSDVLNFYDNDYLEQVYSGKSAKRKEEDDEDTKDARSSRRSTKEEDDPEDEPKRDRDRSERSRSRDKDEEPERGSRRSSREEPEDEPEEDEKPKRTRRNRDEPEEEEAPKASSKRSQRDTKEDEADDPPRSSGRSRRAEPEEEDEPEPSSKRDRSAQARESVDRLKKNQRQREEEAEDEPKARPSRGTRRSDDDD